MGVSKKLIGEVFNRKSLSRKPPQSKNFIQIEPCRLVSLSRIAFHRSCSYQDDCCIFYACAVLGWNFAQQRTPWKTPGIIASRFPALDTKIWPTGLINSGDSKGGLDGPCSTSFGSLVGPSSLYLCIISRLSSFDWHTQLITFSQQNFKR